MATQENAMAMWSLVPIMAAEDERLYEWRKTAGQQLTDKALEKKVKQHSSYINNIWGR